MLKIYSFFDKTFKAHFNTKVSLYFTLNSASFDTHKPYGWKKISTPAPMYCMPQEVMALSRGQLTTNLFLAIFSTFSLKKQISSTLMW
jgi:hypothetical protein